jgi:hypothetical protein
MGGAHMAVKGGRKDFTAGMRNPKEKAPFGEYARWRGPSGLHEGGSGLRGRRAGACGLGRLGRILGEDSKEKN